MNQLLVVNKHHITHGGNRHVYIGRPSVLGSIFQISDACTREQANDQYEHWLLEQILKHNQKVIHILERIAEMVMDDSGKPVYLVCYCAPKPCHGDVIRNTILTALQQAA